MQRVFEGVSESLPSEHLRVIQDNRLVRGLDYYCHTAFEFVVREDEEGGNGHSSGSDAALGLGAQQGTVLAGGRYDGLLESIGGKYGDGIPGIGWAAGVDRLKLLMEEGERRPSSSGSSQELNPVLEAARRRASAAVVAVLPVASAGADEMSPAVGRVVLDVSRRLHAHSAGETPALLQVRTQHAAAKLKKKIRAANAQGAGVCVIVGDEEASAGVCAVRDMRTRVQVDVPVADVAGEVAKILRSRE